MTNKEAEIILRNLMLRMASGDLKVKTTDLEVDAIQKGFHFVKAAAKREA